MLSHHLIFTCGGVDAGSDVEVAESVGMRHAAAAPLVAVVPALIVRQTTSHGGLQDVPVKGAMQGFLKVQLEGKTFIHVR